MEQFATKFANWHRRAARNARTASQPLAVGDWVLEILEGSIPALAARVAGPFEIVAVRGSTIQLCTDVAAFREHRTFWRAAD
jgi:hypothetical protein